MVHLLYAVTSFTCALVTYIMPISTRKEIIASGKVGQFFWLLTRWTTFFCVVDGIWGLLASSLVRSDSLLFIFSTLFHMCAAFTPLMWLMFVLHYTDKVKAGRRYFIAALSVTATEFILIFINLFNKMMFSVSESGEYTSTPVRKILFYIQYAVYILIALYAVYAQFKDHKDELSITEKKRFSAVLAFVAAPILLGVFQMIYPDAPAYSIGYMIGDCIIYSFVLTDMLRQSMVDRLSAEAESKAKSDFLFNMSHDIRTPMNAILGYTDIGIRHSYNPERSMESFKKIKVAGEHMQSIINDILEMSRIEAGRLSLNNTPLDVRDAIEEVKQIAETLALPKSIDLSMESDEIADPYVYADHVHINEMLMNVLSNAVKYTSEGGKVHFRIQQLDTPSNGTIRYRFTISDTGVGISEEFQEHIFDSFSREESRVTSSIQGTGLGLTIVKQIVDMAGGTISVNSALGKGTTFIIDIPFRILEEEAIEELISKKTHLRNLDTEALKGKRVLLVDDNEMNREIALELLSDAGLVLETAEDGAIALEDVERHEEGYYDFILMDIQMPVMNGYESTVAIRKLQKGKKVPIIALSANAFKEDIDKSLESGMNAHVSKPMDVNALINVLCLFCLEQKS